MIVSQTLRLKRVWPEGTFERGCQCYSELSPAAVLVVNASRLWQSSGKRLCSSGLANASASKDGVISYRVPRPGHRGTVHVVLLGRRRYHPSRRSPRTHAWSCALYRWSGSHCSNNTARRCRLKSPSGRHLLSECRRRSRHGTIASARTGFWVVVTKRPLLVARGTVLMSEVAYRSFV